MEWHFGFRAWLIWGSVKAIDLPNMAGSILNMRNFVSPLLPQFSPATIVSWTSIPALFAWTTIFLKTCLPRPIAILHVPHRLLWPCEEFAVPSHSEREPLADDARQGNLNLVNMIASSQGLRQGGTQSGYTRESYPRSSMPSFCSTAIFGAPSSSRCR